MNTQVMRDETPPRTLDGLTGEWLPLAIEDERTYRKVMRLIDRLAVLERRTKAQERYLETLTILAEAYENVHHAIDIRGVGPIEMLKFLMEQNNLSGRDLGRLLGQPQLGGKILRGERKLSKAHIATLCSHFRVSADVFMDPTDGP
jgi:HTH-type transcriptional regulator/antitoxin HigA